MVQPKNIPDYVEKLWVTEVLGCVLREMLSVASRRKGNVAEGRPPSRYGLLLSRLDHWIAVNPSINSPERDNGNVHRAAAKIIVSKSRAARGSVCNVLLSRDRGVIRPTILASRLVVWEAFDRHHVSRTGTEDCKAFGVPPRH